MENLDWLILAGGGVCSGILAGLLGIGGGFIIVSLLAGLRQKSKKNSLKAL